MAAITYSIVFYKNENRILVQFEKNEAWNRRIKTVYGAKWSKTLNGWTIPDTPGNRKKCGLKEEGMKPVKIYATAPVVSEQKQRSVQTSKEALSRISNNNNVELQKFLRLLALKAYSPSTIRTYRNEFAQLLNVLGEHEVQALQPEQIQRYLLWCIKNGLSGHGVHSRINALKFYFEQALHRDKFFFEIPRPVRPLQLPKVLNKEEIAALINAIKNVKHKTMIMLAYGCGLRVSEIIHLAVNDIDGKRRVLFIEKGKGKKDRVISLSPALLIMLREYYRQYMPKKFLFEGTTPGTSYSVRSLEEIIKVAKQKAGIIKSGSMHMLRHSFATHLLEKGIDVKYIKELLGHFDIRTTERYLHVSKEKLVNIVSPLDSLYEEEMQLWITDTNNTKKRKE